MDGVSLGPVKVAPISLPEGRGECLLIATIDLRVVAQQEIRACAPDPPVVNVHDRLVVVATIANRTGRSVIRLGPDLGQSRRTRIEESRWELLPRVRGVGRASGSI